MIACFAWIARTGKVYLYCATNALLSGIFCSFINWAGYSKSLITDSVINTVINQTFYIYVDKSK